MLFSTRRGSLGYLKGYCPMDKDYWSSLGMFQEFWVNVESILKETEKMLLKERTMFICDLTIFACPTDDSGWHPRCDSICSESLIGDGEGRMIKALRQLQCFFRLSMSSIIWQRSWCMGLEGARHWAQCRDQDVYEVNKLRLLRSSAQLFIHTTYLGQTVDQVHADLIEVHQRTTVNCWSTVQYNYI